MRSIGSFLVCASALLPILRWVPLRRSLRWFCLATAAHGFLQGLILAFGIPINSHLYAFEWYSARIVQLVFAMLYVSEITTRKRRLLAGGTMSVVFGLTPLPTLWFNWLPFGYAFVFSSLGLAVIGEDWIMGAYWLAFGAYQYTFLRLSTDPGSRIWSLNYWLPSAISIIAFLTLGFAGQSPSRSRPPGDL